MMWRTLQRAAVGFSPWSTRQAEARRSTLKRAPHLLAVLFVLMLTGCAPDTHQSRIDPQLATEIARIKAIDNHAHPVRPVAQGEKPDDEYDAMPVETLEASSDPVRLRPKSPELLDAQRHLFSGEKTRAAKTYGQD